ncbi:arsenic resistance protein [Corynebacterium propinquum]
MMIQNLVAQQIQRCIDFLAEHQVLFYVAAILLGLFVSPWDLEKLVAPTLGLLMLSTFSALPLRRVRLAPRLTAVIVALNFLVVPCVVWVLVQPVRGDQALLLGITLVLLAPCIDYVVPFSGLAGAANHRLLAITPLLFVLQMLLLSLLLPRLIGAGFVEAAIGPIVRSVVGLLVIPLGLAWFVQRCERTWRNRCVGGIARQTRITVDGAMVPLMVVTLFAITATYGADVFRDSRALVPAVAIYVVFAAIMVTVGFVAARVTKLRVDDGVAAVFSGVTRNSLVVMPIALAFPEGFEAVPIVIVAQTLVELCVMVLLIKTAPYLQRLLQ